MSNNKVGEITLDGHKIPVYKSKLKCGTIILETKFDIIFNESGLSCWYDLENETFITLSLDEEGKVSHDIRAINDKDRKKLQALDKFFDCEDWRYKYQYLSPYVASSDAGIPERTIEWDELYIYDPIIYILLIQKYLKEEQTKKEDEAIMERLSNDKDWNKIDPDGVLFQENKNVK